MKKLSIILIIVILSGLLFAGKYKEKDYQNKFAEYMKKKSKTVKTEHVLPDKTRVDILTDKYAIEVDWANKWAEGIGQSLYYGLMTKKIPGVVLILKSDKDKVHLRRLKRVAGRYEIIIWTIDTNFIIEPVSTCSIYIREGAIFKK
jgi:hypothetical protein